MVMKSTILTPTQQRLLHALFAQKPIADNFYLSGGTALAEYYLHHRYSEDLDFFTDREVDPMAIQVILKRVGVEKMDFQQTFNRNLFFLHIGDELIKSEFTYYPFTHIETPQKIDSVKVDSLIDIAVNKTFTIYQRPRSRDFIDLYLILKSNDWTFAQLRQKAQAKFDSPLDPLQLAQQLHEAQTVEDFPRMVISLPPEEWRTFWQDQSNLLKQDVLN